MFRGRIKVKSHMLHVFQCTLFNYLLGEWAPKDTFNIYTGNFSGVYVNGSLQTQWGTFTIPV